MRHNYAFEHFKLIRFQPAPVFLSLLLSFVSAIVCLLPPLAGSVVLNVSSGAPSIAEEPFATRSESNFAAKPEIEHLAHHPRLLVDSAILTRVHKFVQSNKLAAAEYALLQKRGEEIIDSAPVAYKEGDLLEVSRTALKRIYILGLLHQLKPEPRLAARAKKEMLAACSFPNWHPDHFLDAAEMTHAVAIGYDWFFEDLNDDEKSTIRNGIFQLGLSPGMKACKDQKEFWVKEHRTNWSLVCYGGLLIGSLAVGNDSSTCEQAANFLLPVCIEQMRQSLLSFEPDGGWCEGLNYWNYSTIYATSAIAALETSSGTDFGLSQNSGLEKAGFFFIDSIGPSGLCFNFADAVDSVRNSPQLFWLSRRYHLPVLAFEERCLMQHANDKLDARDLLWFSEEGKVEDKNSRPLASKYRGSTQMGVMRTSWSDPQASFVALKGGDNATHHSHLELGTFVFDSGGCRWATQLGMENYDLPGYFEKAGAAAPRWKYYRTKTEGQNTVVINEANQDVDAKATVYECDRSSTDNMASSSIDANCFELNLNEAYKSIGVTKNMRTATLSSGEKPELLLTDSIAGNSDFKAVWQMHTRANVKIEDNQAILNFGQKRLLLKILSPLPCLLSVSDVKLEAPQLDTEGVKKLTIRMLRPAAAVRFAVVLVPFEGSEGPRISDLDGAKNDKHHDVRVKESRFER